MKKKEQLSKIARYAGIALCILAGVLALYTAIYYIVGPSRGYFHSDCSDSLFWALASYDSGKIVSEDYNYAAILPFGASLWYVPLIAIFGVGMKAQIIGMVIFALLFFGAILFACRSLSWSRKASFVAAAAELLLLSGSDKLREIMWGHTIYYSLGLLLLFFGIGLAVRVLKSDFWSNSKIGVKSVVWLVLTAVFTLLTATNGFQVLVLSTLPVAFAIFCERFFDPETKLLDKKNHPALGTILLLAAGTMVGMLLMKKIANGVTAGYEDAYSTYTNIGDWIDHLLVFPEQYFSLIGINLKAGDTLISLQSVLELIKFVASIALLVLPIVGFCLYKKLQFTETKYALWIHLFVTLFVMLGWTLGSLSNAAWRLVPVLGTAIFSSVSLLRDLLPMKGTNLQRLSVLCTALLLCFGLLNMSAVCKMEKDYGRDNDLYQLTEKLKSENLTYGYATFWNSQAITVISDDEVKTRNINVGYQDGFTPYYYQSEYSWFADQAGQSEYFVLLSEYEYSQVRSQLAGAVVEEDNNLQTLRQHLTRTVDYECNGNTYHILVFDCNIWIQ